MLTDNVMPRGRFLPLALFSVFLLLIAMHPLSTVLAAPDPYPTKPVRLVINFAPGGSTDTIGRLIAIRLSERMGKQVIAENRSGAGGILGAETVAKSAADGYTLLFSSSAISINPLLFKVPYDPVKSFIPIAKLGDGPSALVVHPGVPAHSVKELIAVSKKQPGKLVAAAAGGGSFIHLSTELFKLMAGIDFKIVQFKGGGPAVIDTIGGHSQLFVGSFSLSLPHIKSGKLRALGYGGAARTKLMPDLPTISEAGVPGYESAIWWGLYAPAGTPKAVVERLYRELEAIMKTEEMQKTFEVQGADPEFVGSTAFVKFMQNETAKWGKVIKEGNIKGEE
jgi:tripartite-type tricarboxylate transporter receptor subunit TctC